MKMRKLVCPKGHKKEEDMYISPSTGWAECAKCRAYRNKERGKKKYFKA
jgi:hypothetical protein